MRRLNLKLLTITGITLILLLSGCNNTMKVPCRKGCETDKEYFRSSSSGISARLANSEKEAKANAKGDLAASIETKVKRLYDVYGKEYGKGKFEEYSDVVNEESKFVTKQIIRDLNYPCFKTKKKKVETQVQYETFVCLEMPKNLDDFYNKAKRGMQRISESDKLDIEFHKEKFRKIFEKEMEEYDEE